MSARPRWAVCVLSLVVALPIASIASGQLRYWSGQNIAPTFEGWQLNPGDSFNMVFGYYNRNLEEVLDIPIGPDNSIEPGGPDQGQPTFFAASRHKYVFSVRVPKDWDKQKRLVWTLTAHGKTEKANAFLLPEWETNDQVAMMNSGGGGDTEHKNQPSITAGPDPTITLSDTATLTVAVTDDGLPKPRPAAPGARRPAREAQLRVDWLQFRGPVGGRVPFTPGTSPVTNGVATTKAAFTLHGYYVLRGFANDGALTRPADVHV